MQIVWGRSWLGSRSCSGSCWFQVWYIRTAFHAVAERTVYDLGGWSLNILGTSSDTGIEDWYRSPGWQETQPQGCTGLYTLPSVGPCRLDAKQLSYQAVMQPVKLLSMVQLYNILMI
jgi:hypothetical protein